MDHHKLLMYAENRVIYVTSQAQGAKNKVCRLRGKINLVNKTATQVTLQLKSSRTNHYQALQRGRSRQEISQLWSNQVMKVVIS